MEPTHRPTFPCLLLLLLPPGRFASLSSLEKAATARWLLSPCLWNREWSVGLMVPVVLRARDAGAGGTACLIDR